MKIAVMGLWHLGSVTAACLAERVDCVVGWDPDPTVVADLGKGEPPLFEPGLGDLIRGGLSSGHLRFTPDLAEAVRGAQILWVTFDTPVDDEDRGDVGFVEKYLRAAFPYLDDDAVILVSSQLPVGFCRRMDDALRAQRDRPALTVSYSPENLRLGDALATFARPERIVVGVRDERARGVLEPLLSLFCDKLIWMSVESAEMAKHAVNAFLATSVAFINELAVLGERVGVDAADIEKALKSERRIGPHAFLRPGSAFSGGTLARDLTSLVALADRTSVAAPLLRGVLESNRYHFHWTERTLEEKLGSMSMRTVAVLGLTYKLGTDTLRRSAAVRLCEWLIDCGAQVRVFDPAVKSLPAELPNVMLCRTAREAWQNVDALVVATAWPELTAVTADELAAEMGTPCVIDPGRALARSLQDRPGLDYVAVGMHW